MDNNQVIDLVSDLTDSTQVAGMEVVAVAFILFAIGMVAGILIFFSIILVNAITFNAKVKSPFGQSFKGVCG